MDADRFNHAIQLLNNHRLSRRAVVAAGSSAAALALGMTAASRAGAESGGLIYIYSAVEGAFIPESEDDDRRAELTLMGATDYAVYVADRPERATGLLAMEALVDLWPFPVNDPPNAALVFNGDEGRPEVLILEVNEPDYDAGQRLFRASVLRLRDRFEIPFSSNSLGMANLFIDPSIVPGQAPAVYGTDDAFRFLRQLQPLDDQSAGTNPADSDRDASP